MLKKNWKGRDETTRVLEGNVVLIHIAEILLLQTFILTSYALITI